jgi:hypothetical protein
VIRDSVANFFDFPGATVRQINEQNLPALMIEESDSIT